MTVDAGADADRIAALFTGEDGAFRFARWERPIAPVIYGTDDEGIQVFEGEIIYDPGTTEKVAPSGRT